MVMRMDYLIIHVIGYVRLMLYSRYLRLRSEGLRDVEIEDGLRDWMIRRFRA